MVNKNLFQDYKQISVFSIVLKKLFKFTNTCTYILVNVDVYNLAIFTVHHRLFICECGLL